MSWNEGKLRPYKAGTDLSAKQYHFVKAGPNANEVQAVTSIAYVVVGIVMNNPGLGEQAEVAKLGGGAKLKMVGVVAAGDLIKTDATGQGVVASVDGENCYARAEAVSAAGDVTEVERVDRQF